jgi:hypothetical protein
MFWALGLVFVGAECVGSCCHVFRALTRLCRYRGRRVLFFMFCAPGLIFGNTEGVGSRFHVLRARTHFRR